MQLLPLFLAVAALAAANQQPAVVTVTNYLPFEQHRCYEYFVLGGNGDVPAEACRPGACCVGVKDVDTNTDNAGNNVGGHKSGGNNDGGNNVGSNNVGGSIIVGITVGPDGHTTTTPCPCSSGAVTKIIAASSQLSIGASSNGITRGPVMETASPSSSISKRPSTSSSVITSFSISGSVTLTLIEVITNNRTFTKEITATSIETLPETSREIKVVTTTVPKVITFNTTSAGQVIIETSTSEVFTIERITNDLVISKTSTLTTPVVVTSTKVITPSDGPFTSLVTTTSEKTLTTPVVVTTAKLVTTSNTTFTSLVTTTSETTLTTPVVVTSTEVITPSDSPFTSLVTTTSEETLTTVFPSLTTTTVTTLTTTSPTLVLFNSTSARRPVIKTSTSEVLTTETITTDVVISTTKTLTTPSIVITPTLTTITTTIVEPIESLIPPPPPEPSTSREIPKSCPTPTCSQGIQYALYTNPFRGDLTPTYKSFSPAYFKKQPPVYSATLQTAIFITDQKTNKGFNPLFSNAAAGYRGFLFACRAGRYRFNSPYSDDITIMWFGDKAYDGYTRENADIVQAYYGDNRPKTISRDLAAGTYYPIRVLWGNTGGASDLSLRIYGPDGEDISGADQKGEHYLTTEACDGTYAPYPPWGQEK
ncbi:hypothetical protein LLEC1_07299 [Akanthomyces lecanii]|uniref:PA14 domain-containing protein n=1 Tax=Cordyceps confragosa TaxID=2714763 RepID=A0A179IE38_CORDF|nr:hypothetical protein LLEC1_07299 [Akanthomyces lecanii]